MWHSGYADRSRLTVAHNDTQSRNPGHVFMFEILYVFPRLLRTAVTISGIARRATGQNALDLCTPQPAVGMLLAAVGVRQGLMPCE